jgi:hypothetical protein
MQGSKNGWTEVGEMGLSGFGMSGAKLFSKCVTDLQNSLGF